MNKNTISSAARCEAMETLAELIENLHPSGRLPARLQAFVDVVRCDDEQFNLLIAELREASGVDMFDEGPTGRSTTERERTEFNMLKLGESVRCSYLRRSTPQEIAGGMPMYSLGTVDGLVIQITATQATVQVNGHLTDERGNKTHVEQQIRVQRRVADTAPLGFHLSQHAVIGWRPSTKRTGTWEIDQCVCRYQRIDGLTNWVSSYVEKPKA